MSRVRVKQTTNLYKASDEPSVIGTLEIGATGIIMTDPHMGKVLIKFDDGRNGWVAKGDLERTSG